MEKKREKKTIKWPIILSLHAITEYKNFTSIYINWPSSFEDEINTNYDALVTMPL